MAQSISQEAIGATGLPGATAASRHAGATTSGAPTTGTFAVGDYVVDQTGAMYVCTVAGTPGTWVRSGIYGNPAAQMYQSTTTSVTNTTATQIVGMTGAILKGGFTFSSNSLIVPVTGVYQCSLSQGINYPSTTFTRWISYLQSGSTTIMQTESGVISSAYPTQSMTQNISLTAGNAITLWMYQNSGVTVNASAGGVLGVSVSLTLVSQ